MATVKKYSTLQHMVVAMDIFFFSVNVDIFYFSVFGYCKSWASSGVVK